MNCSIIYSCQNCHNPHCMTCEALVSWEDDEDDEDDDEDDEDDEDDDDEICIKTIGSRYCDACVDVEAKANGLPLMEMFRLRAVWRRHRLAEPSRWCVEFVEPKVVLDQTTVDALLAGCDGCGNVGCRGCGEP